MDVYPLIFEPLLRPKMWGGRRLQTHLGKSLPEDTPVGESWEIADLEQDQSVVRNGPARGKTLRDIVESWGPALLGRAPLLDGRFPLLIKFLDAAQTLSVQVHPDESAARRLGPPVRAKHEAWYVVDARDDAFIYRGLKPGVGRDGLRRAVAQQRVESVLNRINVRAGHCYYLPSGTAHALGAGALVAEIQTPSDVTYRLYDWNRVDPSTGVVRDLHVEQALECVLPDAAPMPEERRQHVGSVWTSVTHLVRCEWFQIERVRMIAGVEQPIPYQEMVIWIVLEGAGIIKCPGAREPVAFARGDTVLLPAELKNGVVKTDDNGMWLEVSVPIESSLAGYDRPERGSLHGAPTNVVPLDVPHDRRQG